MYACAVALLPRGCLSLFKLLLKLRVGVACLCVCLFFLWLLLPLYACGVVATHGCCHCSRLLLQLNYAIVQYSVCNRVPVGVKDSALLFVVRCGCHYLYSLAMLLAVPIPGRLLPLLELLLLLLPQTAVS